MKHIRITVSGKVQGVFFRASTQQKAKALGLKGFVRNEANGDVYIEAEGDDKTLKKFVDWCMHGPEQARVDHCVVTEGEVMNFNDFSIRR